MRMIIPLLLSLLVCAPAMAEDTPEARLRDMLRRTTTDLRAAQDSQALVQASLDQEKQKTATLQKQLEELSAHPAPVAKPSMSEAEIARMRSEAQGKVAALESGLKQWQDAYRKAADLARAADQDARNATSHAAESQRQASICASANTKLLAVANDILHLYQTQSFRSLLVASYEPLLGLKKVELENIVQDYEDKILDQKYRPGRDPAPAGGLK